MNKNINTQEGNQVTATATQAKSLMRENYLNKMLENFYEMYTRYVEKNEGGYMTWEFNSTDDKVRLKGKVVYDKNSNYTVYSEYKEAGTKKHYQRAYNADQWYAKETQGMDKDIEDILQVIVDTYLEGSGITQEKVECEWSNMMDIYLQRRKELTRDGWHTWAQVVAIYDGQIIEGGWILPDAQDDDDQMVQQALMVYWVNSEVMGTGR